MVEYTITCPYTNGHGNEVKLDAENGGYRYLIIKGNNIYIKLSVDEGSTDLITVGAKFINCLVNNKSFYYEFDNDIGMKLKKNNNNIIIERYTESCTNIIVSLPIDPYLCLFIKAFDKVIINKQSKCGDSCEHCEHTKKNIAIRAAIHYYKHLKLNSEFLHEINIIKSGNINDKNLEKLRIELVNKMSTAIDNDQNLTQFKLLLINNILTM